MRWRSIGLQTDLELAATRGPVIDRDDYSVVVTPDDPSYYFGNLLVLPAAPQVGEVAYWTRKFATELTDPAIRHVTLRWDGVTGDVGAREELEAAGFALDTSVVLTATKISAPATGYTIRPLLETEMRAAGDLAFAIGDRHDDATRTFSHRRAAWQRELVASGRATWWGAFEGEELIASLGLVVLGDVARYQDVQTAAAHRKRGLASALLGAAANAATGKRLIIVVEPDSAAQRVYERAGFAPIERIVSACRYPT